MGDNSIDVKSIMDLIYGESSNCTDIRFVYADEGKQIAQEDEVIQLPEKDKNYSSFWRKWYDVY